MVDPLLKENKKKTKRNKKKDKIKRWNIVFVEDSDTERENVKVNKKNNETLPTNLLIYTYND
jgi:hypothetical protein